MRILKAGVHIEAPNQDNFNFLSDATMIDCDILAIDIATIIAQTQGQSSPQYDKITVQRNKHKLILERVSTRKNEISEFLSKGGLVLLELGKYTSVEYHIAGTSGIGDQINFLEIFGLDGLKTVNRAGKNIEVYDDRFDFFEGYEHATKYEAVFNNPSVNQVYKLKGYEYTVGGYFQIGNGFVFIVPKFDPNRLGKDQTIAAQKYYENAEYIYDLLKNEEESRLDPPEWAQEVFTFESQFYNSRAQTLLEINEKKARLDQINDEIERTTFLKSILYESGDNLERVIEYILRELNYEILDSEDNKDDLIIKKSDAIAVVEVKGVNKSSGERHAAQLQKWVSNYHAKHGVEPKGVLIVNGYRDVPIQNRKDDIFPEQMMEYVSRMRHSCIDSVTLFSLFLDFQRKLIDLSSIHRLIFDTIGIVNYQKSSLINIFEEE